MRRVLLILALALIACDDETPKLSVEYVGTATLPNGFHVRMFRTGSLECVTYGESIWCHSTEKVPQ